MFSIQLLIVFLLLSSIHGTSKSSHRKEKLQQLLKSSLNPDYDDRYVWFTRNIHSERRNPDEISKNNLNRFLYRKASTVKIGETIFNRRNQD
jgi:hypothetical protein